MTEPTVMILNPWDSQGNQIAKASSGIYPTVRGCGGAGISKDTCWMTGANMSYQKVTGALTQGAHPGSYNGQDAYNDMLVTDGNCNGDRTGKRRNHEGGVSYFDG